MKFVKNGSSIIEVLIAATLISIAVLASLALASRNQKQTDFSRSLNRATFYNNQSLEWLSNMRSVLGWAEFYETVAADTAGSSTTYCLNLLPEDAASFANLGGVANCDTETSDGFQREMKITFNVDNTSATVQVTTYWDGRQRSTASETVITKW